MMFPVGGLLPLQVVFPREHGVAVEHPGAAWRITALTRRILTLDLLPFLAYILDTI